MLFNSFGFLALVLISLAIYYLPIVRKYQVHVLILASLVFYGYSNPWLLILFLTSVAINVSMSYLVVHGSPDRQKLFATIGVAANLLILAFFKYSPLIASTFFDTNDGIGAYLTQIPLPIGISFFTFEGITLLVDAYKGRKIPEYRSLVARSVYKHAVNTTFFVAFFPHLIAGPILKAHDFIPQIKEKLLKNVDWNFCFKNLVTGYFLKMVIADQLSQQTFWIQPPFFEAQSSFVLITLLFGYSMQIFADFAGYSLIALGVAGLYGYNLMTNFNFPYISISFSEFWRRWHISLSTFLKEYLYIPLGGNRRGEIRTHINLLVTMILGGLWHGAGWNYAVWGTFHGLALALERLTLSFSWKRKILPKQVSNFIAGALVFSSVSLGWLLFKLTDINQVAKYILAIFTNTNLSINTGVVIYIFIYSLPVVFYHLQYLYKQRNPERVKIQLSEPYLQGVMLFLILTNSGVGGDFIYFQF